MARCDPRHARVEGVEQGLFALALRLVEADVERRAHHEALELGLHDPVRAAGPGQAQVVATLRVHASHSCFIPRRGRPTRSRKEDMTKSMNRLNKASARTKSSPRLARAGWARSKAHATRRGDSSEADQTTSERM